MTAGRAGAMKRLTEQQVEIFRRMTPQEKIDVATGLRRSAERLAEAGVRMRHPAWPAPRVEAEVRRMFLHGHG